MEGRGFLVGQTEAVWWERLEITGMGRLEMIGGGNRGICSVAGWGGWGFIEREAGAVADRPDWDLLVYHLLYCVKIKWSGRLIDQK